MAATRHARHRRGRAFSAHNKSEFVEELERKLCCKKDDYDEEDKKMSAFAVVTLKSPSGSYKQRTETVDDCGRTFDFVDFESEYEEEGRDKNENKDEPKEPVFRVAFPRPALTSCNFEIKLVGLDGFKKERIGSATGTLADVFWDHGEVKEQPAPAAWQKMQQTEPFVQDKRFSLNYEVLNKGVHQSHFSGTVKCRFTLTADELIVDFIDAQELRDLKVPLTLDSIQPWFLIVSILALVLYFVFGILFFSYVPMNTIHGGAASEACGNDTGAWEIVETAYSSEWSAPTVDRFVDSFYFTVVVFTSVGFGDIIIIPSWLRMVSIIFVLWGTVTLGFMIHLGSWVQEHIVYKLVACKHNCQRKSDMAVAPASKSGGAVSKKKFPKRQHLLGLEVTVALVTFFVVILMAMFIHSLDKFVFQEPDPDSTPGENFVDALYFAVISCSTIGFGDETPGSTGGRLLTGFFLLVALPIFGNTVAVLSSVPSTRRKLAAEASVLAQYGSDLDADELRNLILSSSTDASSCTRAQFITTMLLKQAKISPSDIKSIGKYFDSLDDDNSGFLDLTDVDEDPELNKTHPSMIVGTKK